MLGSDNLESSDGINAIVTHKEAHLVQPCPKCLGEWPYDWEYCPNCAISLHDRQITREITRFVPSETWGAQNAIDASRQDATGHFLACDFRCYADHPSPEDLRYAKQSMELAFTAMRKRRGKARALPNLGILGYWDDGLDNTDLVVRAATEILRQVRQPNEDAAGRFRGASLGVGIVSKSQRQSASESITFAFRLAALAQPNGGLVSSAVYSNTVEHFDYCGVCPTVPKSEPLSEMVFRLRGAKSEISGTHQTGPDTIPLVGRHELVKMLDDSCREVADGRPVVLHLIGEPGMGKSRLLREWLNDTARQNDQREWIRFYVHGVPYGGYSFRALDYLVKLLSGYPGKDFPLLPEEATGVEDVFIFLRRLNYPCNIIVDDVYCV